MKTDLTPEEVMPNTISPEDALTLALTNKRFAKHVVRNQTTEGQDPDQAGVKPMHHEARRRHNAKMIRENKIKASELSPRPRSRPPNRTSHKPLWDADQLRLKLQSYDRTPFLDILAIWMECAPTPQTIMEFADRYPDRWAKAIMDLGKIGGFAEKREVDINFEAHVKRMSDSQLEDQLREQAYRLGIPLPALLTMMGSTAPEAKPSRDAIDITPLAKPGPDVPRSAAVEPPSSEGSPEKEA